ncbi:MAG: hypothetical protein Q8O67_07065 [Deltaproteobacteria bacterium]|nr:hypothetical protein [Deltaproteobacteria bacterium]
MSSPLARASLLSIGFVAGCTNCEQAVLTRGNLDRVADVVVVNATDGNSIAVSANPEIEHLRVLDLTLGRFTAAPNRFSPLSIPTGPDTRAITIAVDAVTTAEDPRRLYALDGSDDTVRIIRLEESGGDPAFLQITSFATGRAPADVAALTNGLVTIVAVVLPDESAVAVHLVDGPRGDVVTSGETIALPAGSHPSSIVIDPMGLSFVVGDAVLPQVHVLAIAPDNTVTLDQSLDVLGPVHSLAAGVVDVGDGLAPVVVALRSDTPAIMAVRLFRPGFREDRYAVLGGAALPALGSVAYVPDARPSDAEVTVCCEGLAIDALRNFEATAAWAAVWMANGDLLYVQLAATRIDGTVLPAGRTLVRLVDDDVAALSAPDGIDLNENEELWVPAAGGEARRPIVSLTPVDNFGTPAFVPLTNSGTSLLLVWEGDLTTARRLRGGFAPSDNTFETVVNVEARGARVGDIARLEKDDVEIGCEASFRARITAVVERVVTLATDGAAPFLTAEQAACLDPSGDTRLTVEVQGAFVVEDGGRFLGRLAPAGGAEDAILLSGVSLSFAPSASGLPLPGSRLAVPLDPHVTTLGLNLADAVRSSGGGFGPAALVPTGIDGGTLIIPDGSTEEADDVIPARRMVLASGSIDGSSGLPLMLTCDEGETITGRVESFR